MLVGRVCYLPKFDFGKYVRWSCLLLAKIFNFGKYVRLTVCLSVCVFVCLSVRNFFDTGHSFRYIVTKLGPSMYLCHVTMPIVFLGQRSNK